MSLVKGANEPHVAALGGELLDALRDSLAAGDWDGLRQSHFRLMSQVPDDGISITDLAERLGMSKQGCGQFVTPLGSSGYLDLEAHPGDRRVRVVRRTAKADAMLDRVEAQIASVEQAWARQVGTARYATFRAVMSEIVGDSVLRVERRAERSAPHA